MNYQSSIVVLIGQQLTKMNKYEIQHHNNFVDIDTNLVNQLRQQDKDRKIRKDHSFNHPIPSQETPLSRNNIQQKIKEKYQEKKYTLVMPFQSKMHSSAPKKIDGFCQAKDSKRNQQKNDHHKMKLYTLFVQQVIPATSYQPKEQKIDCKYQLSDKKKNNPQKWTRNPTNLRHYSPKNPKQRSKLKESQFRRKLTISNFGYQMDGSIYHFQYRNLFTDPDHINSTPNHRNQPGLNNKDEIYEMLRNTTPLTIKAQPIKSHHNDLTSLNNNKHQKFLKTIRNFKVTNHHIATMKHLSSNSKAKPTTKTNQKNFNSKQMSVSGWEYSDQY